MKIHILAILSAALILAGLTGCSNGTGNSGEISSESDLNSSSAESDFVSSEAESSADSSENLWKDFECGTVILKYTGKDEKVEISDSVTEIGAYSFAKCSSLKEIVLPKNLSAIEYSAFSECAALKTLAIPDGVKKIGNDAFCTCVSLENVTIPDSVTEIGCDIFCGCEKLQAEYKGKTYSFAERFDLYKAIDSNYDETVPAHR